MFSFTSFCRYSACCNGWLLVATAAVMLAGAGRGAAEPTTGTPEAADTTRLQFNRHIRPILAEHCLECHGPDAEKREADLRLDLRSHVLERNERESQVVVPGKVDQSELVRRVMSAEPSERMPPPDHGNPLKPQQIELLQRWVAQGAPWTEHWAYEKPIRPALPALAFSKPTACGTSASPRNPIDLFTQQEMARHQLAPSPPADRRTLIRRVTFDLLGSPPTPEEVSAFLQDERPDAYQRLVDRLLASPRYGERMAVPWLDLARYADTHGYHIDSHRDMWRWRDWVIEALNSNLPFDDFTIEQLAGDLLPDATRQQKLATGFLRNNMINFENGAIAEEYLNEYLADRVVTVSTVWLGQTMQCARCHDHKYDPFTQRDFYGLYAFFNTIPEKGLDGEKGNAEPFLETPTHVQQYRLNQLAHTIAEFRGRMQQRAMEVAEDQRRWEQQLIDGETPLPQPPRDMLLYLPLDETDAMTIPNQAEVKNPGPTQGASEDSGAKPAPQEPQPSALGRVIGSPVWLAAGKFEGALLCDGETFVEFEDVGGFESDQAFSYGGWIFPTTEDSLAVLSQMSPAPELRGYDLLLQEGVVSVHLIHEWDESAIRVQSKQRLPLRKWQHVMVAYDGSGKAAGIQLYVDGQLWELQVTHDTLSGSIRSGEPLRIGRRADSAGFRGMLDDMRIYDRQLDDHEVALLNGSDPVLEIAKLSAERRSEQQARLLTRYYLENHDAIYQQLRDDLEDAERQQAEVQRQIPTTMVMSEMDAPRPTHILARGDYQHPGQQVRAGLPEHLPALIEGEVTNRLQLARWLVHPEHPLTARVAVNRYWQWFFGEGLVRTPEDFGTRGELPTHPELLDWLACEFIDSGWDVKHLHRLIVTSATYRQSNHVTDEHLAKDPENRFLARAPRKRLSAEMIRDNALAVSGLLQSPIGGASVYPYQPPGLWEEVSFNPRDFTAQRYIQSTGADLYRRGLYSFWKRAVPPPSLVVFDAPDRETCLVQRSRTNTPLQALVLMNDPTFVEAARVLAERLLRMPAEREEPGEPPGDDDRRRLGVAFERVLSRPPLDREAKLLLAMLQQYLDYYEDHSDEAESLCDVGEYPRAPQFDASRTAAWTLICSTLLNLDEAIHRN